jgi:hypothetical protein
MSGKERAGDLSEYKLKQLWESSKADCSAELFSVWQEKKRQAQTDLFWLCLLLGYLAGRFLFL